MKQEILNKIIELQMEIEKMSDDELLTENNDVEIALKSVMGELENLEYKVNINL